MPEPRPIARLIRSGIALSFQDRGRPGWRRFGIAPCGALDPQAAAQANELLGNPLDAVVLEFALGGTALRFKQSSWLALSEGAQSEDLEPGSAQLVRAGETLNFQPSPNSVWSYLAIPGGWRAPKVFASASHHARSGLGLAIADGDLLYAAAPPPRDPWPSIARRFVSPQNRLELPGSRSLRLLPGPHLSNFPTDLPQSLTEIPWRISSRSDRSGYRLESLHGGDIEPGPSIPSLPVLPGFLQITRSGQPILTLADGPTVGGYPVPALLHPEDLPLFVRHPPGSEVRFVWAEG